MQFEDAFPLADGWLALSPGRRLVLPLDGAAGRPCSGSWPGGPGAGLYLFAMDVLYDLQHGVWGKAPTGWWS